MGRFRVKLKKAVKKRNAKRIKPFFSGRTLLTFFLIALIGVIGASVYAVYVKSPYFTVMEVVVSGSSRNSTVNYADLRRMATGKNIFKLRLNDIRNYMLDNYNELLDLRLERAFPGSIIATAVLRKPAAQVHRERYYPIDEYGVILSGVKDSPDEQLPVINGASFNPAREIGKVTDSRQAKKALSLIKELNASGILDAHILVEIDVSRIRNVIFFLEDGMEIKIGHENYASRLKNLKDVLSDPKLKPSDIRYIDLRFKEPVIGPKWKR